LKTADERLSLATLCNGAAVEKFDVELQRALNNVLDPNTLTQARTVTLKVKIKPNEEKTQVVITADASSNLSPHKGVASVAFIGRRPDGHAEAREVVPQGQTRLFNDDKLESEPESDNVRPFKTNEA
jgi:hypothetical protein